MALTPILADRNLDDARKAFGLFGQAVDRLVDQVEDRQAGVACPEQRRAAPESRCRRSSVQLQGRDEVAVPATKSIVSVMSPIAILTTRRAATPPAWRRDRVEAGSIEDGAVRTMVSEPDGSRRGSLARWDEEPKGGARPRSAWPISRRFEEQPRPWRGRGNCTGACSAWN